MGNAKKESIVDPDYEMTESTRERLRQEERDSKDRLEKFTEIINREFHLELSRRQSQLELIQQRLNHAQKTLHLLRYVLITAYYSENEKATQHLDETTAEEMVSNKSRLHPAIKKLIGNTGDFKLNFTTSPRKRKHLHNQKEAIKRENAKSSLNINKIEPTTSENQNHEEFDTTRNRKKSKYQIVVGNISKWMPSHSEEDKSTHKWMVYVRGPKENPDISHFVQKVVFFLHPSYHPNDVIEVRDGPFHLTRRGWGEFPLRIKIFFKCPLNKPVDIVHNLKLDKMFTGRQTLGNETVVHLLLYSDTSNEYIENSCASSPAQVKVEDDEDRTHLRNESIKEEVCEEFQSVSSYYEHDYCVSSTSCEPQSSQVYNPFLEHCYFSGNALLVNYKTETISEQQEIDLMYGIKEEAPDVIEESVVEDVRVPITYHKIIVNNGTVIALKKRKRQSLLKRVFERKYEKITDHIFESTIKRAKHDDPIDYDKYKIEFPSHRFKTVIEALPYLLKRLPLISQLANDVDYKCTYPFTATSLREYSSWNLGRRSSSEWYRAKTILSLLSKLPNAKQWSAKDIVMYARAYGYTPLANYEIFKNKTYPYKIEEASTNGNVERAKLTIPEVTVDVVGCSLDSESETSMKPILINCESGPAYSFIKQAMLDVGVILKPEEIIPGVLSNVAEQMVLQATMCLAEDIIRRAWAHLVYKDRNEKAAVDVKAVNEVLTRRPQFAFLRNS